MKCYIAQIRDTYGEFEFNTTILTRATDDTIKAQLAEVCACWYSEDEPTQPDADDYYEHPNGFISCVDWYKEISEATFNELKPLLGDF